MPGAGVHLRGGRGRHGADARHSTAGGAHHTGIRVDPRAGPHRTRGGAGARRPRRLPAHAGTHPGDQPAPHPRDERAARPCEAPDSSEGGGVRVLRVFPAAGELVDLEDDDSRERLLDWYRPDAEDWVRLNLISTVSGSAAGPDNTSESITTSADRRILGVIRQLADVVLVGAGTVRVEGYQLPKRAALAIVTASGDLGGHQLPPETRADQLFV